MIDTSHKYRNWQFLIREYTKRRKTINRYNLLTRLLLVVDRGRVQLTEVVCGGPEYEAANWAGQDKPGLHEVEMVDLDL